MALEKRKIKPLHHELRRVYAIAKEKRSLNTSGIDDESLFEKGNEYLQ